MAKADTLALASLIGGTELDQTLMERFYRDVVWEFGQAELMVQATILAVEAGTGEFELPERGVRLLSAFYDDEEIRPLRLTDVASIDPHWRDARGRPLAYIVDDASARVFRLYPIPDVPSKPVMPWLGMLGAGFPEYAVTAFHTEAPDDVLPWLELPVALTVLAREFVRESSHRDPAFAAHCQGMATALMTLGALVMPTLGDPRTGRDAMIDELRAEIGRLQGRVVLLEAQAKRDASAIAGEWVINRPMSHTGELLGFFGVSMQARQPHPTTLAEVIDVLTRFGFTR